MTWRTSRIIFNWRRRASHNQMTWELGLSEKWKRRNDFGLNHKRTKYCAYVVFWISGKFIPLPGISLSPSPPLAKFLGIPSSRLPGISAPPQLLSRRSFHRSMAFQHWHSSVSLWSTGGCATLHSMFRLFLWCLRPLPTSPEQGEGDEQQKQLQEGLDRGSELSFFH